MTEVGATYGAALYELAKSENLSEIILSQLSVLEESFSREPEFLRLLDAAGVPKQERCDIIDSSFREICHIYVVNFLKILTEKGYIRHFSQCCQTYRKHYNLDHNILPVQAVTAAPLSESQIARLTEKLSALTGKTVQLENRLDSKCLGGIRLDYDGKQLDDTLAHRLDSIRAMLKNTVL